MNRRSMIMTTGAAGCFPTLLGASQKQFFVPPEDSPHELTFMQWPVSTKVYRDRWFLKDVQATIAEIANAIAEFEPVIMLAGKEHHQDMARVLSTNVEIWDIPTDDLWCRDAGPIFATNGEQLQVQHIQFNGWGNRQPHGNDGQIAERVADRLGIPIQSFDLRGEAGGIEQDGYGTLIAHESSWVHENRNPGQRRDEIEERLLQAYGADRLIWAPGVMNQDITDYHIDSLVRFTGPNTCLINLPEYPIDDDDFHQAAALTHRILEQEGISVQVIPEPNRKRVKDIDFVASYANYYVCNNAVIAAEFGDKETDEIALNSLQKHYPDRHIVTLNVDALGELGGGIHCATHEMPKV